MKTTEIIDLLTKMMNEAEDRVDEYANISHSHAYYYQRGRAAALAEAINEIIRKEHKE